MIVINIEKHMDDIMITMLIIYMSDIIDQHIIMMDISGIIISIGK